MIISFCFLTRSADGIEQAINFMRNFFTLMLATSTVICAMATEGALTGEFTVNKYGDKVHMSKGNLQFCRTEGTHLRADGSIAQGTWRFAENQYDLLSSDDTKWIDEFGWGTSGYDNTANDPFAIHFQPWDYSTDTITVGNPEEAKKYNPFGYGPSKNQPYRALIRSSSYYDWGVYNSISNGGNTPQTWRSLTAEEWEYIQNDRPNAEKLNNLAVVCGVSGWLLLPDGFKLPEGLSFTYEKKEWQNNVFDAEAWSKLETAGAVFLPVLFEKVGTKRMHYTYWNAGSESNASAGFIGIELSNDRALGNLENRLISRYNHYYVRLAQDIPTDVVFAEEKSLDGVFSVSEDTKVNFSQGNLQCYASKKLFQFAEQQYDYLGLQNEDARFRYTFNGWFDLFVWGNGQDPCYADDRFQPFFDWGNNPIHNGGNEPHQWRTLTKEEWKYLFRGRPNAEQLFGLGKLHDVQGLILLPDNWTLPSGVNFVPAASSTFSLNEEENKYISQTKAYTDNVYTISNWRIMESAGAVFLPAALLRQYGSVNNSISQGVYWTSDGIVEPALGGFTIQFKAEEIVYATDMVLSYYQGASVRLVKEVEVEVEPKVLTGLFSVADNKQVRFSQGNLQCKSNSDLWRFATEQYTIIGANNAKATVPNTWIDLFGFATSGKLTAPWETSKSSSFYATGDIEGSIAGTDYDWLARNGDKISNGGEQDWRLLSASEWDYLLNTRQEAATKQGQAVINGVKGYVLLPDEWERPVGISFAPMPNNYTDNVYDGEDWQKMETAGAVFLPAAGDRYGTDVNGLTAGYGYYWTGDLSEQYADMAIRLTISSSEKAKCGISMRCNGSSIRPVADYEKAQTSLDANSADRLDEAYKVFDNSHIYIILPDGRKYNIFGCEIK